MHGALEPIATNYSYTLTKHHPLFGRVRANSRELNFARIRLSIANRSIIVGHVSFGRAAWILVYCFMTLFGRWFVDVFIIWRLFGLIVFSLLINLQKLRVAYFLEKFHSFESLVERLFVGRFIILINSGKVTKSICLLWVGHDESLTSSRIFRNANTEQLLLIFWTPETCYYTRSTIFKPVCISEEHVSECGVSPFHREFVRAVSSLRRGLTEMKNISYLESTVFVTLFFRDKCSCVLLHLQ